MHPYLLQVLVQAHLADLQRDWESRPQRGRRREKVPARRADVERQIGERAATATGRL